jgi:hypothetical protein
MPVLIPMAEVDDPRVDLNPQQVVEVEAVVEGMMASYLVQIV